MNSILPEEPSLKLNGNQIVDYVMDNVREQIRNQGLEVFHVPKTPSIDFKVGDNSVKLENGTIVGLANVYRVGDVTTTVKLQETKLRAAFEVKDVSTDHDIALQYKDPITSKEESYPNGHIHMDVDNVTIHTVYKINHLSVSLTLDEFELTVGNYKYTVTGLGERAENDSELITNIVAKTKDPVLNVFNFVFKGLVNVALKAARTAVFPV